ncbi:MAG TPA: TonB-dependent receptor [Chryseosolibacter sp.]|nr:TonB-dependent receptor [Chryseosolibacter sp.]
MALTNDNQMCSTRFEVNRIACLATLTMLFVFNDGYAQSDIKKLKSLSIEQLMSLEVTSVARSAQLLSEVASAIQVITNEAIQRSGATTIPEALRLATNLQISQLTSSAWLVGTRGFNTVFANKLLVLIDGRTVYTPLFGGVLWEFQNVLLEDVDRIEVISGPGGTLWGVNAVNGVINIITKSAKDTHGLFVTGAFGTYNQDLIAARYGSSISEKLHYRAYAQRLTRKSFTLADGTDAGDAWGFIEAGFRVDWNENKKDNLTIQGDVQKGVRETAGEGSPFDSQNLLARWTHTYSEKSELILQTYYDRYWRDDAGVADELETYDIDFQHRFVINAHNTLLWGLGYRLVHDELYNRTIYVGLLPEERTMPLYSAFVQDEIEIGKVTFTVGSKFQHNIFSGLDVQPSVRLAFAVSPNHTLWAAASRAVRAPSRFDVDYFLPLEPQPPEVLSVAGGPNFTSEKMHAYEIGFRSQPTKKSSLSLAGFYNEYHDLYSVETLPGTNTYQIQNGSVAETWGGEFSGFHQLSDRWRIRAGFTYFGKDLRASPGRMHDPAYLSNDATHMAGLQSMLTLPANIHFDVVARYLDYIPASFATARVPEYFTFDVRLAWEYEKVEFALVGQNLYAKYHSEMNTTRIPRHVFGRITWRL